MYVNSNFHHSDNHVLSFMEKLKSNVISNIKRYRKQMELSQYALAENIDVSIETIAKIETGRQFPSYGTLVKLVEFFKIEPYMLFLDEGLSGFEREKYIDKVYPLIIQDVLHRMRNTKVDDEK